MATQAKMISRLPVEQSAAPKAKDNKPKVMKKVPKKKKKLTSDPSQPDSVATSTRLTDAEDAAREAQATVHELQAHNWQLQEQLGAAREELYRLPALQEDLEDLRTQLRERQAQQGVWEDQRRGWELERQELLTQAAGGGGSETSVERDSELAKRLEDTEANLARAQDIARDEASRAETAAEDLERLRNKCIDGERKLAELERVQQQALAKSALSVTDAESDAKQRIDAIELKAREQLEHAELASRQRVMELEMKVSDAEAKTARLQRQLEEEAAAKRRVTEQMRELNLQKNLLDDELRKVCNAQDELPTLCQHCNLPWDGSGCESSAATAAAAAARERVEGREEPVITAAFGPERLAGIERAVATLREEHAKELETLKQAVEKAKQRAAEANAQCVKLEHEVDLVLEQKELAETNAARALEAMAETVRATEDRASEAERRADMGVAAASEAAYLHKLSITTITTLERSRCYYRLYSSPTPIRNGVRCDCFVPFNFANLVSHRAGAGGEAA